MNLFSGLTDVPGPCLFLVKAPLGVGPFIWNVAWASAILRANQGHVLGDEYIFTFGQVGALV